ncbi:glycosyltransferase [Methylobacterium sp. WL6]|uniref:glycosyltransferase n=1 Tax=Methylobacterium sp. WL6 TaxID=2603901 RepID=UPI001FEFBA46|nr:glycosyltransferase [Methylobacterium sp. WL6]
MSDMPKTDLLDSTAGKGGGIEEAGTGSDVSKGDAAKSETTVTEPFDAVDADIGRRVVIAEARLICDTLFLNDVRIAFRAEEAPLVSIVIVSLNARHILALTLWRLAAQQGLAGVPFEVIVVDNASMPETGALLDRIDGATLIRNAANAGFGPACNDGAARARGRLILFLNPDVDLMPGAIRAMARTFTDLDHVGIVGARLVFPGGILQEAGANFQADAQITHPYLRGVPDPFVSEASFTREVGYVSGAVLMIERALFQTLGGFDDAYAPAYFEDTDLCVRCHQAGRRVIYQARATAVHFENATSAKRADVEMLLDRNRALFLERHRNWLFHQGPSQTGLAARDHDPWALRVLFIDDTVPHLDMGAGYPRANHIVNTMAELGYGVTLYPIYRADAEQAQRCRDIDQRVEILASEGRDGLARLIGERPGYFDVLWVSRPHNIALVMQLLLDVGSSPRAFVKSRVVFDSEALFASRAFVGAVMERGSGIAADLARDAISETRYYAIADQVVCVSEAEVRLLANYARVNATVLGHAMALPEASGPRFADRAGFLFIGALGQDGQPNVDSLDWFFDVVWPRLRARMPDTTLRIVGTIAPAIRARYTRPGVMVMGRVPEAGPFFDAARVCLAPTRFAAGIPHKVHEAVRHGLPCFVTPILAAQIGWEEGVGYESCDWLDPEAFAEGLVRLHETADLWRRVQSAGLARIRSECAPETYREHLRRICEASTFA